MAKTYRPTLVLDFDGVLHRYTSGWQGVATIKDGPMPGAILALLGYLLTFDVAIYSSRSSNLFGRCAMRRALAEWGAAHFDQTFSAGGGDAWCRAGFSPGMDPPDVVAADAGIWLVNQVRWPWFKPAAFLTIDDRVLRFQGLFPDPEELRAFRPWKYREPTGTRLLDESDDVLPVDDGTVEFALEQADEFANLQGHDLPHAQHALEMTRRWVQVARGRCADRAYREPAPSRHPAAEIGSEGRERA